MSHLRRTKMHRLTEPVHVPACLRAIFQKPDTELGLDEILLNLLNCENTSGMRSKHYPKASFFLSPLNTCQYPTMLLQDPFSCLEGRWSCPAWKDIPVERRRQQESTAPILKPINQDSYKLSNSAGQWDSGFLAWAMA